MTYEESITSDDAITNGSLDALAHALFIVVLGLPSRVNSPEPILQSRVDKICAAVFFPGSAVDEFRQGGGGALEAEVLC